MAEVQGFYKTEIGGVPQQLYVQGPGPKKPFLLFIHGGPGFSMTPYCQTYVEPLSSFVNCVHWDQRGIWRSFQKNMKFTDLKIEDYVDDLLEVIKHLRGKYLKDSINICGHSWGSMLTLLAAKKCSLGIGNIINVGQASSIVASEKRIFETIKKKAQAADNRAALSTLEKIGSPPHIGDQNAEFRKWTKFYRGTVYSFSGEEKGEDDELEQFKRGGLFYQDHGADKIEYERADPMMSSINALWDEIAIFDMKLIEEIPRRLIICQGLHDLHTHYEVASDLFQHLRCPAGKKWEKFEESAHFPQLEETKKFCEVIKANITT